MRMRLCVITVAATCVFVYGLASAGDAPTPSSTSPAISNVMGPIVQTIRDLKGHVIKEVDADGKVMTYSYGADGVLKSRTLPDGTRVAAQ